MPDTALHNRLRRTGLLAACLTALLTAHGGAVADTITPGVDGPANTARIDSNWGGFALTPSGEVVIADSGNNLIRKLSADYRQVTTLAGTLAPGVRELHYADGNGPAAKFAMPNAVAVDAAGNTYVADNGNHLVRKISPAGEVTTLAGQPGVCGIQDGVGQGATLCNPTGIAVDPAGTVYVVHFTPRGPLTNPPISGRIRKITPDGVVSTFVSATSQYSSPMFTFGPGRTFFNVHIAVNSSGTLYSVDPNDRVVRRYAADGQATVVSGLPGAEEGDVDGPAAAARFGDTLGIAFDRQDSLFILERMLYTPASYARRAIRRVDGNGSVTTVARSADKCDTIPRPPEGVLCDTRSMGMGAHGEFLVAELARDANNNAYMTLRSYTQQGTSAVVIGPGAAVPVLPVTAAARMDGPLIDTRLQIDVSNVPAMPGQQLWFAMLHNSQLMFLGGNGFVTFQCPGSCDAPANRAASGNPQRLEYPGLDVRGFIGAKLYIGWGRSFAEMVDTGQVLEVHTIAAQP